MQHVRTICTSDECMSHEGRASVCIDARNDFPHDEPGNFISAELTAHNQEHLSVHLLHHVVHATDTTTTTTAHSSTGHKSRTGLDQVWMDAPLSKLVHLHRTKHSAVVSDDVAYLSHSASTVSRSGRTVSLSIIHPLMHTTHLSHWFGSAQMC